MPQHPIGNLAPGVASAEQVRRVELTAAEVRGLNGTPIELVPAPGDDKAIVIGRGVFFFLPAGTAFGPVSGNLRVQYDGTTSAICPTVNRSGFLSSSGIQRRFTTPEEAALTIPEDTAVELTASAVATAGRNGLAVDVYYYVIEV